MGVRGTTTHAARVVVLSEVYRPELTSTGYYLSRIAEHLAEAREVHAVCGQPSYALRGQRAPRREQVHGVAVRRVRGTSFDRHRHAGRLVNMATLTLRLACTSLATIRRGDLVVAVTNPPTLPVIAAVACRLRGARLVVLLHDRYPEILLVTGTLPADSRVAALLRRVMDRTLRMATQVVVIGRDAAADLAPALGERVRVITNWAEDESIHPLTRAQATLRDRVAPGADRVVLSAGNFGPASDLATVLDAAALLADDGITLALVGDGRSRSWVEAEIARRSLHHVIVAGPFPRDRQEQLLAIGDLVLIASIAGMRGVAVPSRTYNALAAGKPLVVATEPDAEVALTVAEERLGWVVPPHDAPALAQAIRAAFTNGDVAAMGTRSRAAAEQRFAERTVLAQWSAMVDELTRAPDTSPAPQGAAVR